MTLTTTEELKHLASSDNANELTRRLARECLANREAQPVALVDRRPAASGSICWKNGGKDLPHGTELFTAPPAPARAQIAGYFVRQRPEWDKRAPWTPWKEVDAASYDDIVKIIATGEAYCGWFYDTRILYDAPPAQQSTNAADWGINMQTGTPILVYKNCSVIESEQAHYVLSLINSAATPAVPDGLKSAVTFYEQVKRENTPVETGAWKDAVNWVLEEACRAAMLAAVPDGGNDA